MNREALISELHQQLDAWIEANIDDVTGPKAENGEHASIKFTTYQAYEERDEDDNPLWALNIETSRQV